jgi:hypothetical protein
MGWCLLATLPSFDCRRCWWAVLRGQCPQRYNSNRRHRTRHMCQTLPTHNTSRPPRAPQHSIGHGYPQPLRYRRRHRMHRVHHWGSMCRRQQFLRFLLHNTCHRRGQHHGNILHLGQPHRQCKRATPRTRRQRNRYDNCTCHQRAGTLHGRNTLGAHTCRKVECCSAPQHAEICRMNSPTWRDCRQILSTQRSFFARHGRMCGCTNQIRRGATQTCRTFACCTTSLFET